MIMPRRTVFAVLLIVLVLFLLLIGNPGKQSHLEYLRSQKHITAEWMGGTDNFMGPSGKNFHYNNYVLFSTTTEVSDSENKRMSFGVLWQVF
jgi:phosphoglycerol transferase MdoB-like AlkP superfamily enzyme